MSKKILLEYQARPSLRLEPTVLELRERARNRNEARLWLLLLLLIAVVLTWTTLYICENWYGLGGF